jgi:hypothetical protein
MPCFLSIGGEEFDAISFSNAVKLENSIVKLKGELVNPRVGLRTISYIGADVSKADFKDFPGQIEETISYLKNNQEKLSIIKNTAGISFASINFGVAFNQREFNKKQNKSFLWPDELLQLAGNLGISIELTLYAPASDNDEYNDYDDSEVS